MNIEQLESIVYIPNVRTMRYVHWQQDDLWMGYLDEFPDDMPRGDSMEELQENLKSFWAELASGSVPHVRHVVELQLA